MKQIFLLSILFFVSFLPVFSNSCRQKSARLSFPSEPCHTSEYIEIHDSPLPFQRFVLWFLFFVRKVLSSPRCAVYLHIVPCNLPIHAVLLFLHGFCCLCTSLNMDMYYSFLHNSCIPDTHLCLLYYNSKLDAKEYFGEVCPWTCYECCVYWSNSTNIS